MILPNDIFDNYSFMKQALNLNSVACIKDKNEPDCSKRCKNSFKTTNSIFCNNAFTKQALNLKSNV